MEKRLREKRDEKEAKAKEEAKARVQAHWAGQWVPGSAGQGHGPQPNHSWIPTQHPGFPGHFGPSHHLHQPSWASPHPGLAPFGPNIYFQGNFHRYNK